MFISRSTLCLAPFFTAFSWIYFLTLPCLVSAESQIVDLNQFDGSNGGFIIYGTTKGTAATAGGQAGSDLSSADINGDGLNDLFNWRAWWRF